MIIDIHLIITIILIRAPVNILYISVVGPRLTIRRGNTWSFHHFLVSEKT